jgi:hypothetical protein
VPALSVPPPNRVIVPFDTSNLEMLQRPLESTVAERQPLARPKAANEVWSMDFVFDRTAEGRVLKCLTVVDDATHEAVDRTGQAEPERLYRVVQRPPA